MENHKLVMPEHLNHFGYLFGGYLLKWVDENGWMAASLEYPGCNFVTMAMDHVEFRKSVRKGTILTFQVSRTSTGTTSVQYMVIVYRGTAHEDADMIFTTNVTFVRVDEKGNKMALPT